MHETQLKSDAIVIVGGSLAGLTCALALAAHGLRSVVLERADDFGLAGGALGVDRRLIASVTNRDPRSNVGHAALAVTSSYREASSWQLLYRWLRGQVEATPEVTLRHGTSVVEVLSTPDPAVRLADGSVLGGRAILGADGYRSIVRRFVSPQRPLATYTGYMLWRGLVSERLMPRSTEWPDNEGFGALTAQGYRLIAYPVPGRDGSTVPGERQVSFAWYDAGQDDMLRDLGCLSTSGEVLATLPFSRIPQRVRSALLAAIPAVWPEPWNLAVELAITRETLFATPVSEYRPERLASGAVAILGDAAHVATPMTGRGFAMGAGDAGLLAELLAQPGLSATEALQRYEAMRLAEVQAFVDASQALSRRYMRHARSAAPIE